MQTITYQEIPLNDFCNYTMKKKSCYYVVFTFTTAAGKSASSTVYLITQPKVLIKKTKSSVKSRLLSFTGKRFQKLRNIRYITVRIIKNGKRWELRKRQALSSKRE